MAVVIGSGIAGCVVIPWTMYPDVTDAGELAFGRRTSGSFSGIMTFMRKFSSAIGIFIVSQILHFSGYIQPRDIEENGVIRKVMMQQPELVIAALKVIVVVFPIVFLILTFIMASRYPLSSSLHARLRVHLEYLRGESGEDLPADELKGIKDILVGTDFYSGNEN
jgi:Na+/melibiose symporter-like transporter